MIIDGVATAGKPAAISVRKPTFLSEGEVEGESKSPSQGDVVSGNRAGIGNPQGQHQEVPECRRSPNSTIPGDFLNVVI